MSIVFFISSIFLNLKIQQWLTNPFGMRSFYIYLDQGEVFYAFSDALDDLSCRFI